MQYIIVNITDNRASAQMIRGRLDFHDRKDKPSYYFTDHELAIKEAQRLAKESPTQQFAVMSTIAVYETTDPKVITKKYNSEGELVVEK